MFALKIAFWTTILALFHALQEIQIESREGWARRLPTFRINIFLTKLILGKELTGYHIFMLALFVTIFHGIYLFQSWSWQIEAQVFGLLSIYFVLEDFLWFIFNRHYGITKFKAGEIEWHKRWVWFMPLTYWWGLIIGITLISIGMIK